MATKYKRETESRTPPRNYAPPSRVRSATRWFVTIVLAAVCILSLLQGRIMPSAFDQQPLIHGEGIIYDKLVDETSGAVYLLHMGVALDNGHAAFDYAATDLETWKQLSGGDRIGVLYQRSRGGERIRIREAGLVALPARNQ